MKIENGALIEALNQMLTREHAGEVQSAYAGKIRRRIQALGGVPTADVPRSKWPLRTVVHDMD